MGCASSSPEGREEEVEQVDQQAAKYAVPATEAEDDDPEASGSQAGAALGSGGSLAGPPESLSTTVCPASGALHPPTPSSGPTDDADATALVHATLDKVRALQTDQPPKQATPNRHPPT
jgi:hypothetical protein